MVHWYGSGKAREMLWYFLGHLKIQPNRRCKLRRLQKLRGHSQKSPQHLQKLREHSQKSPSQKSPSQLRKEAEMALRTQIVFEDEEEQAREARLLPMRETFQRMSQAMPTLNRNGRAIRFEQCKVPIDFHIVLTCQHLKKGEICTAFENKVRKFGHGRPATWAQLWGEHTSCSTSNVRPELPPISTATFTEFSTSNHTTHVPNCSLYYTFSLPPSTTQSLLP